MDTIEKMFDSLPSYLEGISDKEGNKTYRGLRLFFSKKEEQWVCGYGTIKDATNKKYVGTGFTAIEAVDDFIKNCYKNHARTTN